jgi:magnesium-transporting ATPase (P-type)
LDRTDRAKSKFVPETVNNLAEYGRIGLRTLLLAEKQIDRTYFEDWNTRYMEACSSMEKRDDKMDALQEELETNLVVVGATAIEDKL